MPGEKVSSLSANRFFGAEFETLREYGDYSGFGLSIYLKKISYPVTKKVLFGVSVSKFEDLESYIFDSESEAIEAFREAVSKEI